MAMSETQRRKMAELAWDFCQTDDQRHAAEQALIKFMRSMKVDKVLCLEADKVVTMSGQGDDTFVMVDDAPPRV